MLSILLDSNDDDDDGICLTGNTCLQDQGIGNKRGNIASHWPMCQGQHLSLSPRESAGANPNLGMNAAGSSPL